jgi:hypothetical protein
MYCHPHFDLLLHDSEELETLLGVEIHERATLHEWPLSCVQRLTTSDGRKIIYKTQFGPTVEPEFYANARSELLVSADTIYQSGGHASMLIEYVQTPSLAELQLTERQVVQIGHELLHEIGCIAGELPVYLDLRSEDRWATLVEGTLDDLRALVSQGRFSAVDLNTIHHLDRWAFTEDVLAALASDTGLVHGDLGGDNLFVLPEGYRIIDWQRTKLGPTSLDLATLLESLRFDPLKHIPASVVLIMYFLRINWFTQCTLRWFPEGTATYDRSIAELGSRIARLGRT